MQVPMTVTHKAPPVSKEGFFFYFAFMVEEFPLKAL